MPSHASDAIPSPTASSIFLPLGRRARRDSRSSLSNPADREALNEALDTIHTAASQSQVLTVFNEYTDPPPATSNQEAKTLAGELQGGLSGLYNKLRATVGGGKENTELPLKSPELRPKAENSEIERPASKPSSGRVSRVQSPRVQAFDSPRAIDAASQSSRMSSKTANTSKNSIPAAGPLKSPIGLPHKGPSLIADPTVSETSVHAKGSHASHSRAGSGYDNRVDLQAAAQINSSLTDEDSLRRLRSNNLSGEIDAIRVDKSTNAPNSRPPPGSERQKLDLKPSHERGSSDISTTTVRDIVSPGSRREPYFNIREDTMADRTVNQGQQPVSPLSKGIPAQSQLIGEEVAGLNHNSPRLESRKQQSSPRLLRSPKPPPVDNHESVSQSRLPGFNASQASSVASGSVSQTAAPAHIHFSETVDGTNEPFELSGKGALHKLRSKLLSKDFWMRDENARDCFHCGESFSTFRRKHHCRTCGQIFDNKCTLLISGAQFGSANAIRVCKPCEAIIAAQEDDSSDYSIEDLSLPDPAHRPRTPISQQNLKSAPRDDDNASIYSLSLEQMSKTPTMSFPLRRAVESNNRTSAVLEFDTVERPLARPSSSRSLKTSHSIGHSHKRHHSRHQHIRNFKAYHEDRAPFQKRAADDVSREVKRSAFHRDSIIDPDLAQYLSDDASSDNEQSDHSRLEHDKLSRSVPENERATIGGLLAAVRKGRSRIGERSIVGLLSLGREGDDASVASSRNTNQQRGSRKRNLSASSSIHQRNTPRNTRENLHLSIPDDRASIRPVSPSPSMPGRASKLIRSASMKALNAPSMELNRASLRHVHMLLQQLLRDARVHRASSWENALVPILLRATDDVDPDVQAGDDIDIRNYVKLKKIPGGRPGDTSYVSGLIFTKNVALKSMSRRMTDPKILIITFALEYARHEQHFMSLDPVIRQEREYLENLIGRIAALKPDLLLAERNISGLALELLDKANIATAFNVKSAVLEAVSRCTQSRIIHSIDKLTVQPGQLGSCDNFEVKTYVSESKKKTYIYLSGCPPHLGCTIALRGADRRTLVKVKRITEFMVYVVYNLKLETCLMRDEWALIPNVDADGGGTDPQKLKNLDNHETATGNPTAESNEASDVLTDEQSERRTPDLPNGDVTQQLGTDSQPQVTRFDSEGSGEIPDDVPVPTLYEDLVEKHQTKILSASPFVKFMQPYLLMRARELERRVAYLKRLRDQDLSSEQSPDDRTKAQKFTLIQPEMVHASLSGAGRKVREILHAVHDTEYDKAVYNYETQRKQWEAYLSGNKNLFDPYAHQNIVVLFSQVSTATSVPCLGPDVLAFSFYNEHETDEEFEADCTLGQYVEDLCFKANDICQSSACEKPMYEHHRQYVHGEAQISVFVQPYPAKLRGMQNTVLMWSQCKVCGVETPVTQMSNSTWKYSFGKYLETSIWSAGLSARAGICPHDLHRDHLRYFGYKDFALRIHYDSIELLEIIVPRLRITWKVDNDLRFRNEVYSRIEQRLTRFMVSVKLRLKSIHTDALSPENVEACRAEIDKLTKRANEEHALLVKQLQERYSNSKHWETIPLNRAVRAMMEKVGEWDVAFTEFEKNFFPSEKDIRRLATLQLKKIFLDRDVSVTSIVSTEDGTTTPPSEDFIDEKTSAEVERDPTTRPRRTTILSPEKTQNVLQSVVEEHGTPPSPRVSVSNQSESEEAKNTNTPELPELPLVTSTAEDVKHLDLAIPTSSAQLPASAEIHGSIHAPKTRLDVPTDILSEHAVRMPSPLAHQFEDVAVEDPVESTLNPTTIPIPVSNLPRLDSNVNRDRSINQTSPKLLRAHSQPSSSTLLKREQNSSGSSTLTAINDMNGFGSHNSKILTAPVALSSEANPKPDKKLSERLGLSHLKASKFVKGHSLIPRAVSGRKESRVSSLAKHFEQLSREFEKERIRERKQRAARSRQSRIYPVAASKPIVEVYKDVDEAVQEKDSSEGLFHPEKGDLQDLSETVDSIEGMTRTAPSQQKGDGFHTEETTAETSENEADIQETSRAASDADGDDDHSDDQDSEEIFLPDSPEELIRLSHEELDLKELPKHERTSLMRLLTNFWAERSSSGWSPLEYPLNPSEHVFADCDIIVREDEPSSIIAFALDSQDYKSMLWDIQDHPGDLTEMSTTQSPLSDDNQADVMHSLLRKTGTHLKYQFQEGPAKMLCKIFFAEQFDAVRRKCGVSDRIVESLSRCMKWDSKGGKTKSLFLKTLDDRFVLKSLSPIETQSFLNFAPNYFQIMSEAFFHELPSVIAKMLGFYQIIIKNPVTGVEYNRFLLVMENLFYDRTPTRIFDLKGSMRNRKIQSTGERNEVLLDENMVEFIYESPLFTREHSKKLLKSSVHNDTLFLARQNVMDYSLMVAIDQNRKELVVGIIDCIRTYTWDKKLESWIKDRGFAGGNKNRPTVTSPKEYKKRFREAMGRYVLEAPNCWHQFKPVIPENRAVNILSAAPEGRESGKGDAEMEVLT